MKRSEMTLRALALPLLVAAAACGSSLQATVPDGFAQIRGDEAFRAVAPEGVVYRVRQVPNEPRADLAFWREALKQRMTDAGYIFVAEQPLEAGIVPGYLLELAAPFGQQDNAYLIALFVRDDDVTLAESTGELTRVRARRKAIIEAVERIRW